MKILEFVERKRAVVLDISVPKSDLKALKRVAVREQQDGVSPIFRAVIRSFLHEYRRLEARGEHLPDVWLRHQPSDAVKLVRLQGVLPEDEATELGHIVKLEGERRDMKLTHSSLCRAVIRAFIIANDKAEATDRPVDSADLFRVQAH